MDSSIFDFRQFIGGLSLFLYGMYLFQYSIKKIGSRYLKKYLREGTDTPLKGLLTGTFATAILQSNSVVSLMVLGFVGAGVLTFQNSVGVIIGSNIGATITAWLIGILGFSLNLESIALPIIGVTGILMMILAKRKKLYFIALFVFGFGILLFGLNFMKGSLVLDGLGLDIFASLPLILFVLIGIVLTILVQSTAVCNAIVFTALFSGVISFEMAAMIIIGSNIGTTVTAVLGTIGGTSKQKQVAGVQVLYNIFTAILMLIVFRPVVFFIQNVLLLDGVIGLAAFHTIFNVSGAIIHFPFIKQLSRLVQKILPEKKEGFYIKVMDVGDTSGVAAVLAIKQDVESLYKQVMNFNVGLFHIKPQRIFQKEPKIAESLKEDYRIKDKNFEDKFTKIKKIESYILNYSFQFDAGGEGKEYIDVVHHLNKSVMYMAQSAKMLKDIREEIEDLEFNDKRIIREQFEIFKTRVVDFYSNVFQILNTKQEDMYNVFDSKQDGLIEEETRYLEQLNKSFKEKSIRGNFRSAFFSKRLEEEEFSELIMINNYIFNSAQSFIEGIKEFFLSKVIDMQESEELDKENSQEIPEQLSAADEAAEMK